MFKQIRLKIVDIINLVCLWRSFPPDTSNNRLYRILGFIFLGIVSRLLPHPPNFTAMNAIALFGICSLGNLGRSFFTVFAIMLFSDLIFGFHSSMVFVYFSFGLIILMGHGLKSNRSLTRTTSLLGLSSFLFFVITNFGVWYLGSMYPKTLMGLEMCYIAAIPFYANNLISTLLYGAMLFGWQALIERNSSRAVICH